MQDNTKKPLISIVIVNYNGLRFLERCFSSLSHQTYKDFEIFFIDNGSSDDSSVFVRDRFPSANIIETGKNLGFAGGTNTGILASHGDFILTLNNDTIADPFFIENLINPMLNNSHIGMCASKMLFPDGRINSTGICISRSGAAWDRGIFETDSGQYDSRDEVFGPCAGAALYRRSMLNEIGLFDEDFFIFMEDVDLAFRAQSAGWKCRFVPSAKVTHIMGGTSGKDSHTSVYYGNRNLLWNVIKNFPVKTILFSLPWIVGRNCADIPFYFLRGKGLTIIRAKIDCLIGIPKMLRKRRGHLLAKREKEIERWILTWRSGKHV